MTRINDIVKEEEDKKNKLKLDKASSARIIKRSLWMHASKKSSNQDNHKNGDENDHDKEKDDSKPPQNKHVRFN